jgi:hypothetical protein
VSEIIDIHPHIVSPDTKRYPLAPLGGTHRPTWLSSSRPTFVADEVRMYPMALSSHPHPSASDGSGTLTVIHLTGASSPRASPAIRSWSPGSIA